MPDHPETTVIEAAVEFGSARRDLCRPRRQPICRLSRAVLPGSITPAVLPDCPGRRRRLSKLIPAQTQQSSATGAAPLASPAQFLAQLPRLARPLRGRNAAP